MIKVFRPGLKAFVGPYYTTIKCPCTGDVSIVDSGKIIEPDLFGVLESNGESAMVIVSSIDVIAKRVSFKQLNSNIKISTRKLK